MPWTRPGGAAPRARGRRSVRQASPPRRPLGCSRRRNEPLQQLGNQLQAEHRKAETLGRDLAAAWHEVETQATQLAKSSEAAKAHRQEGPEPGAQRVAAGTSAGDGRSVGPSGPLAQERVRSQQLAQELAARRSHLLGSGPRRPRPRPERPGTAISSPSDTPGPAPAAPPHKGATASPAKVDKPAMMAPSPKQECHPSIRKTIRPMARAKQSW